MSAALEMDRKNDVAAIAFDFSGTLFDPSGSLDPERLQVWLAEAGLVLPFAEIRTCRDAVERAANTPEGRSLRAGCDRSLAAHEAAWSAITHASVAPMLGPRTRIFAAAVHACLTDPLGWRPYPETAAVLEALCAAAIPVLVASNVTWDIRAAFAAHGLAAHVSHYVLSGELKLVKPEPSFFEHVCERLALGPGRVLMVGDDIVCDGAAAGVGMPVFLVPGATFDPERTSLWLAARMAGVTRPRAFKEEPS